jgi:cytochrome c-type biogenesis protein CcmF
VLLAWIFLTIGITAGSYWAYYELGWGGWWFWDPVENASLMPWLAATRFAALGSRAGDTRCLAGLDDHAGAGRFAMAMAGTFLVRSGILTSVHAFAVDPERGAFILGLAGNLCRRCFALFGCASAWCARAKPLPCSAAKARLSATIFSCRVILAIVLVGTLWPLAAEAMGDKISVGPPYFNRTTVPIGLLLMLLLIVGPLLRWRGDMLSRHKAAVDPSGIFILLFAVLMATQAQAGVWPILALSLAALRLRSVRSCRWSGAICCARPFPVWGMALAHLGFAVSVAGMAAESGWKSEKLAAMQRG